MPAEVDPELAARWIAFEDLPEESLGHSVWEMYDGRGFELPGTPGGAPAYLAQHDFVHVIADYGTNLKGELEVFAFIGRADPDPKGFAWLATLTGLFETGYIPTTGFFDRDVREPRHPGTRHAPADRRRDPTGQGGVSELRRRPVRGRLLRPRRAARRGGARDARRPTEGTGSVEAGSVGPFALEGMSETQRRAMAQRRGGTT